MKDTGEEKNLSIMNLNISNDFNDISSYDYWKKYREFYEEISSVLKDNINKTLKKFVVTNYSAIPLDVLSFIVENFPIFEEGNIKNEIKKLPNFEVYDIADLSNKEKLDFYKTRVEIYFLLKKGSLNFNEYDIRFSHEAKLNHKDRDLLGLKASFLTLKDIEKEEDFSHLKTFLERWEFPNSKFYENYLKLLEEKSTEIDFEDVNVDHLPQYLENFLEGYVYYNAKEYDTAYEIWLEGRDKDPLTKAKKRYISRIYEYLSNNLVDFLREEGILNEYVHIPVKFSDIKRRSDYARELSNWKEALNFNLLLEEPSLKDDVLNYLRENYKVLPKEVVEYIIRKVPIAPYENVSKEEYDDIVNLPNLNFKNPNISEEVEEEFYKKRYEYFEKLSKGNFSSDYDSLKEYGFDYSTEVIRVSELIAREVWNEKEFDFKDAKEKMDSMNSFEDSSTIEFYKIYIRAYEEKSISKEDMDKILNINREELVVPEFLYDFIMASLYKIYGDREATKKYVEKLPEELKGKFKISMPIKKGFFKNIFKK